MTGESSLQLGAALRAMTTLEGTDRETREEALWIARAKAGEETAYRWLLERYRARVVRLAAHVLRRDSEAEDVAQEAFLTAFRRLPSFRGDGRFSAWLFQITVRLCLSRRRAAHWTAEMPDEFAPVSPVRTDGDTDTRMLVSALLDQLSPPMRAALVLRELEGLEYGEIAQTLGIPVGTVRSRLNTARAQFRTLWTAAQEDPHV